MSTAVITSLPKPRTKSIDWPTIDALYLEGFLPEAIEAKTGVNRRTISVHVSRHKLNKAKHEAGPTADMDTLSRNTRSKLAISTDKLADSLGNPPKGLVKLNLYADTLQKTIKSASGVHGWDPKMSVSVVMPNDMDGRAESVEDEAIEVEEVATERQQGEQ